MKPVTNAPCAEKSLIVSEGDQELRALMIPYQSGSLEAFQEIYAQLASEKRRYLSHLAGGSEIADDLLQVLASARAARARKRCSTWAINLSCAIRLIATGWRRRSGMGRGPMVRRLRDSRWVDPVVLALSGSRLCRKGHRQIPVAEEVASHATLRRSRLAAEVCAQEN
jgi:hypothetical protein